MPDRNLELEARILANPADHEMHLVYGDWLQSHNDPRGELVIVQAKLARENAGDPALVARQNELLARHRDEWLGELAKLPAKDLEVTWSYGFLRAVRIGPPLEKYATSDISFPDVIATLAKLDGTQFLHKLVIGSISADDYPASWQDSLDAIAEHGVPPNLAVLEIDRGGMWDISSTDLGDLSAAYPKLSRLRELRIAMGAMTFGAIELPALRSLAIETGGLTTANLEAFRTASWPHLETLSLCIGEGGNDYGCDVELDDLRWIFDGENLANVKHLALANSSLADQIAGELARSKILGQLETLDLSQGTFSDAGADIILATPVFRRLRAIDLKHSYISAERQQQLASFGPNVDLAQQQAGGDDDRYVQISE